MVYITFDLAGITTYIEYYFTEHLQQIGNKMNRFEMRERLENKLTKKRSEHSLGVEYVSGCLAMVHGADVNKALTAGLLHDCAKCLPADEKIARCKKHWDFQ